MNIALWIVTCLLAAGYLTGGVAMLSLSKERFRAIGPSQHYVDEFDAGFIKAIGVVKLLGVAGLILPAVLDIATDLVPLAALGLVLLMTGATTVRIVRKEWPNAAGDLIFFALAAFVAWGRFGPAPLGG
ncbi:DoxX family protein [Nocardioides sp. KR10-350]|uniref:DoxX family protein n=1 Tax=Nocardioides cheoyonin TaxID=3156615 RepID=UPI0032B42E9A